MGKFYGKIGFLRTVEEPEESSIWVEKLEEREYYGDIVRDSRRWASADKLNDDLTISNQFSVIADAFAYENFGAMKYVEFLGVKWKVTDVEVQYPRLIISVGGVYNVQT